MEKEREIRNGAGKVGSIAEMMQQLDTLRSDAATYRMHRLHIMEMIYRTIRDVYNADCAEAAKVDA